jgi:hypothetical protein
MEWVVPKYSNNQIDKSGTLFTKPKFWTEESEIENALAVVENHRTSHGYPLLLFRIDLTGRARRIDSNALVAQRTKRLSSIEKKLRRFTTMRLSHMQDIGGCRAVVASVTMVRRLASSYKKSRTKNKLLRVDDYVSNPRDSGYRGIHLIYSYQSDRKTEFNGLKIEIQLRSRQQHAWATAVETVDTFTGQALKGGEGKDEWKRFFALTATYIATKERTAIVPNTPQDNQQLKKEIADYAQKLEVDGHLQAYRATMDSFEKSLKGARYYLLQLDTKAWHVNITGYPAKSLAIADADYIKAEKEGLGKPERDAVLVAVGSLSELKRGYPNYFADTHVFLGILKEAIS